MSVLIDTSIDDRFQDIFRSGSGNKENIRAAKYYLTLGEEMLLLPGGDTYPPGRRRQRTFTLFPGHSAVVSTKERISMPDDLVGIIGARYENSEKGILFFGGMIVDPGYGWRPDESDEIVGDRLFVTIANVGNRAIELRPGKDFIASIAFLTLEESIGETRLETDDAVGPPRVREEEALDGIWGDDIRPLGFVDELEQVKLELDKVATSTRQVVLLGVIVLSVTLCAAVTTGVFDSSGHFQVEESLAHSLGLTLGVTIAAVFLFTGLFYVWVLAVAQCRGLNRKFNLEKKRN